MSKWFGGRGTGRKQGDPTADAIGTVRRSPDGEWLAIMWPSRPSPYLWAITDYVGSAGYETPDRIAHWPIAGAVPFSPAAGMSLMPHPAPPRVEQGRVVVTSAPPPEDGTLCANTQCGHPYAEHTKGISRTKCSNGGHGGAFCACPRFYVDQRIKTDVV